MYRQIINSELFLYPSAFGQMYTYVLYCPDIAMCPWVLEMLSKNNSKNSFDSVVFPQSIECLVLLHSPFIIDMKELAKQED